MSTIFAIFTSLSSDKFPESSSGCINKSQQTLEE